MLFNSYAFVLFLPLVAGIYYLLPQKAKNFWLLIASIYFYMCWNKYYIVLLFVTIVTTYLAALFIERSKEKKRLACKGMLAIAAVINLGLLFFYKYLGFFLSNLASLLHIMNVEFEKPELSLILPVGISFYTFKALSYVIDVYRGKYSCTTNFVHYATYVSFFPAILSGPIDRANDFIPQLEEKRHFNYQEIRRGMLLMLWGYFLKLVVSDRAAQFANAVYNNHSEYSGAFALVATILYSIQIYCDFCGYSCTAKGVGQVLGFSITENFKQPYFSTSIAEFWRRWHISLSSWLKEYVYISLGGNRCSRIRKYMNLMSTFLVSGLWHGASWNYIVWGFLHGMYQIIGDLTKPFRKKTLDLMKVDTTSAVHKNVCRLINFVLVSFSWIFFFAKGAKMALRIIVHMIQSFQVWTLFDGSIFEVALNRPEFGILVISVFVVLIVDILKYKNINIQGWIEQQHVLFRWTLYYVALFAVIIFGVYGSEYSASAFVYFQF